MLALVAFGWLLLAGIVVATPADATAGVDRALTAIRASGGHYARGGASLQAADCSGLVSVAQSIAMGQAPRRLGDTRSLLAGSWPGAIPGAQPSDVFVIGTNRGHMVASIRGVNIEARQSGERFRVGADAASPFDAQFTHRYRIDARLLGVV